MAADVGSERPAGIATIGVVGAGTMGAGIAQVCLGAGYRVLLYDPEAAARESARARIEAGLARWEARGGAPREPFSASDARGRLALVDSLDAVAPADFVIEAAVENLAVKVDLFRALGARCRPEVILTSNTSSLSITALAVASGRPERVAGMHFFNPAPVMKLVEVVRGLPTDDATIAAVVALAGALGKEPVVVADRPGFVANRLLAPLLNEAFYALEEGVADARAIDAVIRLGLNHPMGPLELADWIGLDVLLAILEALHRDLGDPKFRPCPLLRKYVEAGWLGRKTGRGVYDYPPRA